MERGHSPILSFLLLQIQPSGKWEQWPPAALDRGGAAVCAVGERGEERRGEVSAVQQRKRG